MNYSGTSNTTGTNAAFRTGPLSYVLGTGIVPQVLLGFLLSVALYILMLSAEIIYKNMSNVISTRVDLCPNTLANTSHSYMFEQNPYLPTSRLNPITGAGTSTLLPASDNERTGAEFSYSFWIWIDPSSFGENEGLLHVMHKGNPLPFPLLGPGVFLKKNINTLRVYMNSSTTWNTYTEVENIPVNKWVHIVVMARANSGEVYINGNLAKKIDMKRGVVYQNFQNLYVFSQRTVPLLSSTTMPSVSPNDNFTVLGAYTGQLSRLVYFSYAISYTEIQSLVDQGPSSIIETNTAQTPPYLEDKWWVTSYNNGR